MKTPEPENFPFSTLLGLKKKVDKLENLTEKQKLGKRLMEIAKQHPKNDNKNN